MVGVIGKMMEKDCHAGKVKVAKREGEGGRVGFRLSYAMPSVTQGL